MTDLSNPTPQERILPCGCSEHLHGQVPWLKNMHENNPDYSRRHMIGEQFDQLKLFES